MWLAEGVVPKPSREVKGPEWVASGGSPIRQACPTPKKRSEQHRLLALYHDGRLLLAESEFYRLLDDKTQIPKTGAPGRPSSMGIVVIEFERRRELQQCEQSREARVTVSCRMVTSASRPASATAKQSATSSRQTSSPAPASARNNKIGHHFGHLFRASHPSLSPLRITGDLKRR